MSILDIFDVAKVEQTCTRRILQRCEHVGERGIAVEQLEINEISRIAVTEKRVDTSEHLVRSRLCWKSEIDAILAEACRPGVGKVSGCLGFAFTHLLLTMTSAGASSCAARRIVDSWTARGGRQVGNISAKLNGCVEGVHPIQPRVLSALRACARAWSR